MIQVNLLPDIKLKFIKAKRTERLVLFISVIVCSACIAAMIMLYLTVDVFQKNSLKSTANTISQKSNSLETNNDVNKIITIQQQLRSLPALYKARNNPSSILGYLQQVVSPGITISQFTINYNTGALTIGGTADTLLDGNVFYNQLQYAQYTTDGKTTGGSNLFTSVVFTGLTGSGGSTSSGTASSSSATTNKLQYTATANMPPSIFLKGVNVNIHIPAKNVTQSTLDQPTNIPSASTFTK
jgi:hypothetical protein